MNGKIDRNSVGSVGEWETTLKWKKTSVTAFRVYFEIP
jgi:hypothetical protein